MKRITLLSSLIIICASTGLGQRSHAEPQNRSLKAWIQFTDHERGVAKGFVRSLNDSSLAFSREAAPLKNLNYLDTAIQIVLYSEIEVIRFRHLNPLGVIGKAAASGAVLGLALGLNAYNSELQNQTTAPADAGVIPGFAILGAGVGTVIGAVVCITKNKKEKEFIIQGSIERFHAMQEEARIIP